MPLTFWRSGSRRLGLILILELVCTTLASAQTLTLAEAESIALSDDPNLASFAARASALDARAVADGELPDPHVRLGLMNWPIETFDRANEPMSKLEVGIQQVFPRGKTRTLVSQRTSHLADIERTRKHVETERIRMDVRLRWFDAFYWTGALEIVRENKRITKEIIEATQFLYSTGRTGQRDVLRAELDLKLLSDRELETERRREQAVAALAKWIGLRTANRPLPLELPPMPAPATLQEIRDRLHRHPEILIIDGMLLASHADVDIANEAYQPEWRIDLAYGYRGSDPFGADRSDLFSVMINVDVPLFTDRRQDRRLSAAKHDAAAVMFRRDDKIRELLKWLEAEYIGWQRLGERATLYRTSVIPDAENTFEASRRAYQEDIGDFTDVMRDRITILESRLGLLRVQVDRAKAHTDLLYLQANL